MNRYVKRYGVDALGGMALGLFSTLIIGLIIGQIGKFFPGAAALTQTADGGTKALVYAGQFLVKIGQLLTVFTGAGIAVGVAHALGAPKLAVYGSIVTGTIGAYAPAFIGAVTAQSFALVSQTGAITLAGPGDPLSAFVAALVGAELGRLVSGRAKVDILVVPAVTILSGAVVAVVFGPPLAAGVRMLGNGINLATELQPFFMGIILSVVMGMILTLPISSAAIGIMLGLTGLAGGAATAGCSAQMIGFAVISFADNGFNGLFAQGIGTSMLQIPNIAKNPRIWIPPTLASAVTGPIATCLLKMKTLPAGSGMGTSGLVGQIMTYQAMAGESAAWVIIAKMLLIDFLLPATLSYAIYRYLLKKAWIRPGDMKLDA
ncbi:MAG: PTS sugar transporter subunit IIC [Treponemataceae bacterium]|nr:PTS sugar transporter subunit IIC [Treponemataceae bacterium]